MIETMIHDFYAKHRNLDEKCAWRLVVENDLQKRIDGCKHLTFTNGSKCNLCNGYKYECPEYITDKLRGDYK